MADRMQIVQLGVCFRVMHRTLDYPRSDSIHTNAAFRIFDCQRFRCRVQPALGQRCQYGWHSSVGMIDQAGRHLYDMTAALPFHLGNRALRHVEEASQIDPNNRSVISIAVLREWLADEDAGVVHQRVDTAETGHCHPNHLFRDILVADVARHDQYVVIVSRLHGTCGGNHAIVPVAIRRNDGRPDALRSSGYDSHFLLATHGRSPSRPDCDHGLIRTSPLSRYQTPMRWLSADRKSTRLNSSHVRI